MPNPAKQREVLAGVYPGKAWKEKVSELPDSEVVAIYRRLKGQGIIK